MESKKIESVLKDVDNLLESGHISVAVEMLIENIKEDTVEYSQLQTKLYYICILYLYPRVIKRVHGSGTYTMYDSTLISTMCEQKGIVL